MKRSSAALGCKQHECWDVWLLLHGDELKHSACACMCVCVCFKTPAQFGLEHNKPICTRRGCQRYTCYLLHPHNGMITNLHLFSTLQNSITVMDELLLQPHLYAVWIGLWSRVLNMFLRVCQCAFSGSACRLSGTAGISVLTIMFFCTCERFCAIKMGNWLYNMVLRME